MPIAGQGPEESEKKDARTALYKDINRQLKQLDRLNVSSQASALRELAETYAHVASTER